ncbi:MAG TPA: Rieske (2Fe-2S) protein [Kineosporiaceae bacterium]
MRSSAAVPSATAAGEDGTPTSSGCVDRRCMLAAAATAGAAALLTGCSAVPGQGQQVAVSPAAGGAGAGGQAAGNGTAAAGGGAAMGGAGAEGQGAGADGMDDGMGGKAASPTPAKKATARMKGTPLVKLAQIPVGGGMVLPAAKLVVTRPTAGTVKAFSAVCTHQGCVVNQVADGTIDCPCHGARFDIQTGAPTAGPARKPLAPAKVAVQGGTVLKL